MESEGSLPCSQQRSETSPHAPILFLPDQFQYYTHIYVKLYQVNVPILTLCFIYVYSLLGREASIFLK
jgi:hypothetical protein